MLEYALAKIKISPQFIFVAAAGELGIAASWAFPKPNCSSSAESMR